MEEYLHKLGVELIPEENKLHDIEESVTPLRGGKKDTQDFLNKVNESFNESEVAPTDAEIIFLNTSIKNLNEELSSAVTSENYEQAAILRDKIAEHTERLNFN